MTIADNPESFMRLITDVKPTVGKIAGQHKVEFSFQRNIIDLFSTKVNTMLMKM